MVARFGFNLVFGAFWAVYLPVLSLGFIHETEPEDSQVDDDPTPAKKPGMRVRRARVPGPRA
jgi:hypothetical protein